MRRRRAPRIRTVSLGAACAVMLMLTVGTVALVAVSGTGERTFAAFTADEPTLGVAPTISASPSPSAAPSPTPSDDAGGYREPAAATTTPEAERSARAEASSRPSPSASASNESVEPEEGSADDGAEPDPERSPGVLETIVGGLFGG